MEDNPDDKELIRLALRENNIASQLIVVHSGAEALDYLFGTGPYTDRRCSLMPHLILLDVKLPKMHGLEVLRRLRADHRTALLPVVMLTSSDEAKDVLTSYSLGANSYIRKPIDYGQFAEVVRQLGRYWLILNEPPPRALRV